MGERWGGRGRSVAEVGGGEGGIGKRRGEEGEGGGVGRGMRQRRG